MSMSYVSLNVRDNIAFLTLNRPEKHNAFNEYMLECLQNCVDQIIGNSNVRVVVIEGAGKSFCAGADLEWMLKLGASSRSDNEQDAMRFMQLLWKMKRMPFPIIGVIHGSVRGGGLGLMAICDYVLAEENSTFAFSEVRLGLIPAVIAPFIFMKMNMGHARALFISGKIFSAAQALEWGLTHEVYSANDKVVRLEEAIDMFLKNGPEAMKTLKQMMNEYDRAFETYGSMSASFLSEIRAGYEAKEGLCALREKRSPEWAAVNTGDMNRAIK